MEPPRRKHIRLESSIYATPGIPFSITIGTRPRAPIFDDAEIGLAFIQILRDLRSSTAVQVYAYCLMPDHVHLLISASTTTSVVQFVQRWKSLSFREWFRSGRGSASPWQRSFWDHGLRAEEDLLYTARYIVGNPVRAGLVDDFRSYPLCGSMEWEL